ncbi:MAG: hypothetical protein WCT10_02665 [Patescibacteria group bacterium]|jgi:hypothetical protein
MGKKNDSTIVAGAGFIGDLILKLRTDIIDLGGSDEHLFALNKGAGRSTIRKMAKLVIGAAEVKETVTFAQVAADLAFRYIVDPDINERNFSLSDPVADISDIVVLNIRDHDDLRYTSTADLRRIIDQNGYRSATLVELLAYARIKWNGEGHIFALGSSWVDPCGHCHVPYLWSNHCCRQLKLSSEQRWKCFDDSFGRFLVVRKSGV